MASEKSQPAASSRDDGSASNGLVDRVVCACLDDAGRFAHEVIEKACREQPNCAAAIRAQFGALQRSGLLGIPAGEDTAPPPIDGEADLAPLGPYQPLKELGRGGQAVVYLAEDLRLHRLVALKVLKGMGALSETLLKRFRREAEVAARLDHPGICTVYDAGVVGTIPYIAMRYVEGVSLADRIGEARKHNGGGRRGRQIALPSEQHSGNGQGRPAASPRHAPRRVAPTTGRSDILRILVTLEKTARALHTAHEAGIVHRDVKPSNIMITAAGEPVLLDFGLAGDEESGLVSLTATGDVLGTPAYLSPEQLMAKRGRLDRRTDIYSLGVTLFECLTLKRPFKAATREALYQAIQFKPPASARKLNPKISADLAVVLETALEKDRDRRYQTALDLAEDLRRVRESEPIQARPVGVAGRWHRWAKRRPARAALLVLLFLGLPTVTGLTGFILANGPAMARVEQAKNAAAVERSLEEGFAALNHGRPEEAFARFGHILDANREAVEAVAGRLAARLDRGQHQACLDLLNDRAGLVNEHPALDQFRVRALRGLGREKDAAERATRIPACASHLDFFVTGLARIAGGAPTTNAAACRQAHRDFELAVITAPTARLIYHCQLARVAGNLGDRDMAPRVADALTRLWPRDESPEASDDARWTSSEASYWAGWALHRVDPVAAVRHYREALLSRPRWFEALAGIALASTEPSEIIEAAEAALALQPDACLVLARLGQAYLDADQPEDAIACLTRATELSADDPGCWRQLGRAHLRLGHPAEAVAPLLRAAKLDPDHAESYALLGDAQAASGRIQEAIDGLGAAAAHLPQQERVPVLHTLGRVLFDYTREHAQALDALKRAADPLDTASPDLLRDLGVVLVTKGELTEADQTFELADRKLASRSGTDTTAERMALSSLRHRCKQLGRRRQELEVFLRDGKLPEVSTTALDLASLAAFTGWNLAAARLFSSAFEKKAGLAGMHCVFLRETYRHSAAVAAAQLGAGSTKGAGDLTEERRADWRRAARQWLLQDLAAWDEAHKRKQVTPGELRTRLIRWKHDHRLAPVRDEGWIGMIGTREEQSAWRAYWQDVDRLLARIAG